MYNETFVSYYQTGIHEKFLEFAMQLFNEEEAEKAKHKCESYLMSLPPTPDTGK